MGEAFIDQPDIAGADIAELRAPIAPPSAPDLSAGTASPLKPAPRLRILTCLYSFAPGGVERVAARLHLAWTMLGAESRIVLADARVVPPRPLPHVRQIAPRAARGRAAGFVALARGLPGQIADQRPDVLFCAGNTYAALALVLRLTLGRRCPPIVAKISNCLLRPDMPPLLRLLYRRWLRLQGRYINHFIAMAPAMRDEIATQIHVPLERISVIPDPALCADDLARLAAARDAARRDRPDRAYLAVGRLVPQKNFALLLDAFAQVAGPDDTLTILGEGVERARLERRAAALGVARALRLPGHTDPLDPWLAQADVFVLSSSYEGVPAVLIEALAAGVPIVATDCCVSMPGLLGQGALGLIVPTGDAAALAHAMATIPREDPAQIADRRVAAAAFTIEQAAGAYLDVMQTLVTTRAPRAAGSPRTPIAQPVLAAD